MLKSPVVLVALLTTVLGAGAMFTLYTYVAPTLAELTGASPGFVTAMLVLIGIGFTIGNTAGGRYADRSLDGSLIAFLVLVIADMLAPWLASTGRRGVGPVDLRHGAVVPPLQMRVMRAATEAPGLASSVNVGAFNLGNALGAAAGGAVISAGMGYAAVPVAGALIAVAGAGAATRATSAANWPLRPAEGRTRRCFAAGFPACRSGRAGSGTACSGADSACAYCAARVSRRPGLRQARGADELRSAPPCPGRMYDSAQQEFAVHDGGREAVADTSKPITIGVQMDDRLPTKLNTPPVRPSSRTGASADTSDQVIEASPLPKKATARKKMTQGVESVKLAPIMDVEISRPRMMGSLRAQAHRGAAADQKVRQHARAQHADEGGQEGHRGQEARLDEVHAAVLHQMVGNQVRKNQSVEVRQNWPRVHAHSLRWDMTRPRSFQLKALSFAAGPLQGEGACRGRKPVLRARRGASSSVTLFQVDHAAAFLDQLDLGRVGALELARLAIHHEPHYTPDNAQQARADEHHVPAVVVLQPGQHRRQEARPTNWPDV